MIRTCDVCQQSFEEQLSMESCPACGAALGESVWELALDFGDDADEFDSPSGRGFSPGWLAATEPSFGNTLSR